MTELAGEGLRHPLPFAPAGRPRLGVAHADVVGGRIVRFEDDALEEAHGRQPVGDCVVQAYREGFAAVGERADEVDAPQGARAVERLRHEVSDDGAQLGRIRRRALPHVVREVEVVGIRPRRNAAVVDDHLPPAGEGGKPFGDARAQGLESRASPGSSTRSLSACPRTTSDSSARMRASAADSGSFMPQR